MSDKVYFIRCRSTGLIKIGLSENPWSRMTKIQADNPGELDMLGIEEGGRAHETALHQRFADAHVRGEWHRETPALTGYLASVPRPIRARPETLTLAGTTLSDRQLAAAIGVAFSYCAQMRNGTRAVTLKHALALHAVRGERIGPLIGATDEEIAVLSKFHDAPPFFSDVCRDSTRAKRKARESADAAPHRDAA